MSTLRDIISSKLEVEGIEDVPEEVLRDTLEGIEGTLSEKIDAIAGLLNRWSQHEAVIQDEIKRLQKRKATFGNKKRRLKEYLAYQMGRLNSPKIETDLYTVSLRKGREHLVVDNEDEIPAMFLHETVTVDKAGLTKHIKENGRGSLGAHLERGPDYVVVS